MFAAIVHSGSQLVYRASSARRKKTVTRAENNLTYRKGF
jgi:hypothetical protein